MTAINLTELERLAKDATPGPWNAMAKPEPSRVDHGYRLIATCTSPNSIAVYARTENMEFGKRGWQWGDDASFIAALDPQTVLALIKCARAAVEWRNDLDGRALNNAERDLNAAAIDFEL